MAYTKQGFTDDNVLYASQLIAMEDGILGAETGITRMESLDKTNLVQLRDLETGLYVLYGYFSPYTNSNTTLSFDNTMVVVARKTAGSHIFVFTGLNSVVNFLEILVDDTADTGFTYTRTNINLLEMYSLLSDDKTAVKNAEKVNNLSVAAVPLTDWDATTKDASTIYLVYDAEVSV